MASQLPSDSFPDHEAVSPAFRRSSILGRTILRNTIFAAVASIIGPIGFQDASPKLAHTFAGFITSVLGAFVFFWCLRIPAAVLELYITKGHSRRWTFWPHGLAVVVAVVAIAGNEARPGKTPMFRNVVSIQAATVGLLYYLILGLVFLVVASIAVLVMDLTVSRARRDAVHPSRSSTLPETVSKHRIRSHISRLYRTPSRDATVLSISIITAIAGLVQSLDIHHIGRTFLALASGALGLYLLYKLPNVRQGCNETESLQARTVGKHSGKSSGDPDLNVRSADDLKDFHNKRPPPDR
jgi:hypothetical protein